MCHTLHIIRYPVVYATCKHSTTLSLLHSAHHAAAIPLHCACAARCGFLGMLHMEVFMQRLEQEHGAPVVTTTPTGEMSDVMCHGWCDGDDGVADLMQVYWCLLSLVQLLQLVQVAHHGSHASQLLCTGCCWSQIQVPATLHPHNLHHTCTHGIPAPTLCTTLAPHNPRHNLHHKHPHMPYTQCRTSWTWGLTLSRWRSRAHQTFRCRRRCGLALRLRNSMPDMLQTGQSPRMPSCTPAPIHET